MMIFQSDMRDEIDDHGDLPRNEPPNPVGILSEMEVDDCYAVAELKKRIDSLILLVPYYPESVPALVLARQALDAFQRSMDVMKDRIASEVVRINTDDDSDLPF